MNAKLPIITISRLNCSTLNWLNAFPVSAILSLFFFASCSASCSRIVEVGVENCSALGEEPLTYGNNNFFLVLDRRNITFFSIHQPLSALHSVHFLRLGFPLLFSVRRRFATTPHILHFSRLGSLLPRWRCATIFHFLSFRKTTFRVFRNLVIPNKSFPKSLHYC